ncbi:MAG: histidine phosphatase family protein [Deltaproteobacteria bacterium]|nr:histidine phosphatase family protein [Deltaproteobacteria bacterium]
MDPKRILKTIFVRHGETIGNVKGIVQGQWDTPLTAKGIESTLRKAEKIQDMAFDAVFCSDLSRTVETLKLIQGKITGLPDPVYTRDLREIDFGDLSGRLKREIMPTILAHKEAPDVPYPNGESGGQFIARVKGFFKMLIDRHTAGQILVVTHFGVMETAARQFTGPPSYENIHIGPDDVWRMTFAHDGSTTRKVL